MIVGPDKKSTVFLGQSFDSGLRVACVQPVKRIAAERVRQLLPARFDLLKQTKIHLLVKHGPKEAQRRRDRLAPVIFVRSVPAAPRRRAGYK